MVTVMDRIIIRFGVGLSLRLAPQLETGDLSSRNCNPNRKPDPNRNPNRNPNPRVKGRAKGPRRGSMLNDIQVGSIHVEQVAASGRGRVRVR